MHELELFHHPIFHALYHSIIILPLLFIAYLIMEWLEHKASDKFKLALQDDRRTGPVIGALFGFIPFCGTTDLAAGLYSGRIVSTGTFIALLISTSGETLLLAALYPNKVISVIFLLLIKFIIACVCGFIIDLCLRSRQPAIHIHDICEEAHCHCEHVNIWFSAIKHTLPVFGFVTLCNLLVAVAELFGVIEILNSFITALPAFGVLFAAIIGLIPGCAPLIFMLGLYGANVLSASALLAGLITSVGTGFIVLCKTNKTIKSNITIILSVFLISIIVGSFCEFTGLLTFFN